jgi:hypothetical protein
MKSIQSIIRVTSCLWLLAFPAAAQFYPPMTIDPSLMKFLPEDAAFTALVEVSSRAEAYRWPVRIAFLNGTTRVEMDISKMKHERKVEGWADYVGQMQQAGSAESVSIYNPAQKCTFTVLPHLRAYMQQPIPKDALAQLKSRPKPQRVEMGTEEVDGRPATKAKLVFSKTDPDVWRTWESPEAIVWTAKDSPAIPLRMHVLNSVGETNGTLIFKDIDPRTPSSVLFAPAKSFTQCDEQALMQRIMEKWPKEK